MKKGDVLFRIDPSPFEFEVQRLRRSWRMRRARRARSMSNCDRRPPRCGVARSRVSAAGSEVKANQGKVSAIQARLDLAELRVTQSRNLADTGAGNRFDLEKWQADVAQHKADLATALAEESSAASTEASALADENAAQAEAGAGPRRSCRPSSTASRRRSRRSARNSRMPSGGSSETVVRAPADGYPVNLQVRPGSYAAALPLNPVMSFVEDETRHRRDLSAERPAQGQARRPRRAHAELLPREDLQGEGSTRSFARRAPDSCRSRE